MKTWVLPVHPRQQLAFHTRTPELYGSVDQVACRGQGGELPDRAGCQCRGRGSGRESRGLRV